MDPVNPAPAGNPQLTTHLLVSHKKNKNFHPCKVKLRKKKFRRFTFSFSSNKCFQFLTRGAEQALLGPLNQSFTLRGKKLVLEPLEVPFPCPTHAIQTLLTRDAVTYKVKFSFADIVAPNLATTLDKYFVEAKLDLRIYNLRGLEILHLTEEDCDPEVLRSQLRWDTFYFEFYRNQTKIRFVEFHRNWRSV